MDWDRAIERNREALKRILVALVAMAGLGSGQSAIAGRQPGSGPAPAADRPTDSLLPTADCRLTLPRHLHRAVLRLLRPAEAATRRLIIVAARGMPAPPARKPASTPPQARNLPHPEVRGHSPSLKGRPHAANPASPQPDKAKNPPALPLFDRLPRFRGPVRSRAAGVPRISVPGFGAPFPIAPRRPPLADDPIDGARLALRLQALAAALDNLPSHARRFARWRARGADANGTQGKLCDAAAAQGGVRQKRRRGVRRRIWPLRPGRPPGWRKRPVHEVHQVLNAVHELALWAMERTDTS